MPITLLWSPSIVSTNQPPRPSIVNAPAMPSGSPVVTYAEISSSVGEPNRTVVAATASTRRPESVSITQCPVNSVPDLPDISCQRAAASAVEAGFP
jgi:hypothetical protein